MTKEIKPINFKFIWKNLRNYERIFNFFIDKNFIKKEDQFSISFIKTVLDYYKTKTASLLDKKVKILDYNQSIRNKLNEALDLEIYDIEKNESSSEVDKISEEMKPFLQLKKNRIEEIFIQTYAYYCNPVEYIEKKFKIKINNSEIKKFIINNPYEYLEPSTEINIIINQYIKNIIE